MAQAQQEVSRDAAPSEECTERDTTKALLEGFDAHRWFEQYLASHDAADPCDRLAGVPFN